MKQFEFEIPIYDYDIHCIIVEKNDKAEDFNKVSFFKKIEKKLQNEIKENILELNCDGFTFTDRPSHNIVVILADNISDEEFFSTLNHEKRHLIDDILNIMSMTNESEASAYLDGYVSKMFYKNINRLRKNE